MITSKEELSRFEREIEFGKAFQQTRIYKMLSDFCGSGKGKDSQEFAEIKKEIEANPDCGVMIVEYDLFIGREHFVLDTEKIKGNNMFLYYSFNTPFNFDEDLEKIETYYNEQKALWDAGLKKFVVTFTYEYSHLSPEGKWLHEFDHVRREYMALNEEHVEELMLKDYELDDPEEEWRYDNIQIVEE